MLKDIIKITSKNKSLEFIVERFNKINANNYRGMQISQHNRYDSEEMYKILEIIKKVFIENKMDWISIPSGDENNGKNKGFFLGNYPEYEKIVKNIKSEIKKGTANTLKKNFFPDWEKSNIIERKKIKYNGKKIFKFKLCQNIFNSEKNEWIEKQLYYQHYNTLLPNFFMENIWNLLKEFEIIYYHEFLLFFSYIDKIKKNNNLDNLKALEKVKKLIISWRELSSVQKNHVIEILKNHMNPKEYLSKPKDKKMDWGNFNNEIQDILFKLKNANILKVDKDNNICLNFDETEYKAIRDKSIYKEYFEANKVKSQKGFEFDHIVKFSLITKKEDVQYIDNMYNILYIDGYSHAKKTQDKSIHQKLTYEENKQNLILSDISETKIINLKLHKNVLISEYNIEKYLNHNRNLISNFGSIMYKQN